jgi:hypothetical protein
MSQPEESQIVNFVNSGGISAKTYSGCYGGETANIGDCIIVKIVCPVYQPSMSKKQIIFVVDESGSMIETMSSVKASLFAARNSLLRLLNNEISVMDETMKDQVFTESCNVCLITFSDNAYCKWESKAACQADNKEYSMISFSSAVNKIQSEASTNMGDALIMAFEKHIPEYATWIVLLTDGISNKGPCQTVNGFKDLMKRIPEHTKIIPLGYTTSFDPDVLSVLGTMTYLDSEESIAETFGSIMAEIVTCYGIDAKITIPSLSTRPINPDDLIIVPESMGLARDIIGNRNIGCLFNERSYIYGYLPWGNTLNPSFSKYNGIKGNISYYDISLKTTITMPFEIEDGGKIIPDEVFDAYFESSKARLILAIYQAKKNNKFNKSYIDAVKFKLDDWKHPLALPHKEEIFRILNVKRETRGDYITAVGIANSAQSQTNYNNVGRHATTTQRITSSSATNDYNVYCETLPVSTPQIIIDTSISNNLRASMPASQRY